MTGAFAGLLIMAVFFGAFASFWQGSQGGIITNTTAALTATAVNAVGVSNTDGFKNTNSRVIIGNEIIRYAAKGAAGTCPAPIPVGSPCFTTLIRGVAGTPATAHSSGVRAYDETAGYANMGVQYRTLQVQNEVEQASRISLNPFTWGAVVERAIILPSTMLTGAWQMALLPWYVFSATVIAAFALAMAGLVRTVFSRVIP